MPENLDWTLIKESNSTIKELMKDISLQSNAWPNPSVDSERIVYLNLLEKPSWKALLKKAQTRRNDYGAALTSISDCTVKLKGMKNGFKPIEKILSACKFPPAPTLDDPETKQALTNLLLNRGMSLEKITSLLEGQKAPAKVTARSFFKDFVGEKEQLIALRKPQLFKALMAAVLAVSVAKFNVYAKNKSGVVSAEQVREWYKNALKDLDKAESGIYQALKEKTFATLEEKSAVLSDVIKKILEEGLHGEAAAFRMIGTEMGTSPEVWQEITLKLADVLRTTLKGYALANFIRYSVCDERTLKRWARYAEKLDYGEVMSACSSYSIAELKKCDIQSGQSVNVHGRVNEILQIQVNKNKTLSLMDLIDQEGNHLTAVLPYFKIDSCGVVPGSFARITGLYDSQAIKKHLKIVPSSYKEKLAGFNPEGLIIDRLNYGDLSKRSWQNWVTRELSFMFTAVPHGLDLSWNWQTGIKGPANQLCYGTWCGR